MGLWLLLLLGGRGDVSLWEGLVVICKIQRVKGCHSVCGWSSRLAGVSV